MMNTMSTNVSHCGNNGRYEDSGSLNHMTSHGEWFKDMQTSDSLGYVETGDDTTHPIAHTGNIPLSMEDGQLNIWLMYCMFQTSQRTLFLLAKWLSWVCNARLI